MSSHFVLSPGILGLTTDEGPLKWSFGSKAPEASKEDYAACAVRLSFHIGEVADFEGVPSSVVPQGMGKYHYFLGKPAADRLLYRRRLMFDRELQMDVKGLLTDSPSLTVNSQYNRYISHRFMNLHSPGYILTDLAELLLLRKRFAPLHCSAFSVGDRTVVVFAPPNTGKTLSTMTACIDHGADFLAEDLAITDGRNVHAVPWTSTFRFYEELDGRRATRVMSKVVDKVPLAELIPILRARPVTDLVKAETLVSDRVITDLVFLERGDERVEALDGAEVYRMMLNLNRFEFNYHRAPTAVAYEFFNPELDLDEAARTERELLTDLAGNAPGHVIRTPDPTRYARLIFEHVLHE